MDQQRGGSVVSHIRPGMDVVDAEGSLIGKVDRIERDEIRLVATAEDAGAAEFVPLSLVDAVDGNRVIVRSRGDNAFGVAAG